jgi:hypothetical protein
MSISFHDFLAWEAVATDAFLVRGAYVDIAGSFKSGALLGRIVYYYLPSKKSGSSNKLRVERKGVLWIAKTREQWQDEIHLTGKELDRALKQLIDKDIVAKKTFHFAGKPTLHVRLNIDTFLGMLQERLEEHRSDAAAIFPKGEKQYLYTDPIYIKDKEDSEKIDAAPASDAPRCPECGSDKVVSEDKKGRCAYCYLRAGWAYFFPEKSQPKLSTDRYRTHSGKRWKSAHFRDNWYAALETASKSPTCNQSSWFTFEFFVKNDVNYTKMLDNWMSWRDQKVFDEPPRHDNMEGAGQM